MKILLIEQIGEKDFFPTYYFKNNGHEVVQFDLYDYYTTYLYRVFKKITLINWKKWISHKIFEKVVSCEPDIILFYNLEYLELNTLFKIKNFSPEIRLFCWHGDDFLNPKFNSIIQRQKLPLIDVHFTPRQHLANEYLNLGAKDVIKVNWYYKSKREFPSQSIYDISFFGSIDKKRDFYIGQLNFQNFVIGGYGWNKKNINAREIYKHVSLDRMNDLISCSKISLNFLTDSNRDRTNFRNFEIPSQYSLQISERTEEICDIFGEDIGIICFQSPEELNDKIEFYLKNDSLRNKIISNSFNIISDKKYSVEFQLDIIQKRILNYQ